MEVHNSIAVSIKREKLFLSLAGIVFFVILTVGTGRAVLLDRIVAVVNGDIVTKSDIDHMIFVENRKKPLSEFDKKELTEKRKEALENIIKTKLLMKAAYDEGINITPQIVDSQIMSMVGVDTIDKVKGVLAQSNIDLEEFRDSIKRRLTIGELFSRSGLRVVSVSEKEIEEYFNANRDKFPSDEVLTIRVLRFRVSEGASKKEWEEEKKRAESIIASNDETFLKGSGEQKYKLSELAESLRPIIEKLKKGEWSPLIKMSYGYCAFNLVDKEVLGPRNDKEINKKIFDVLSVNNSEEKRKNFIKRLKKEAQIEILF